MCHDGYYAQLKKNANIIPKVTATLLHGDPRIDRYLTRATEMLQFVSQVTRALAEAMNK